MLERTYRQSLLAGFETCALRTKAELAHEDADFSTGNVGASADLGHLVHEVLAEILRTLRRQGESQIPTQEAVEVMREVYEASHIVLPSPERDDLRWIVLNFCAYAFDPARILAIEQPLAAAVKGPDGQARTITGRPDLLMAAGEDGIIIVDYKSGRGKPRSPRKPPPEGEAIKGKAYLSDRGHFQLDCYGLLALTEYPGAEYAILRELHLRSGEIREASLSRDDLEHVEAELGAHAQKLEQAIVEGDASPLWRPRPGKHCLRACPITRSCPIPVAERGEGALLDDDQADAAAGAYVATQGLRDHLRDALKAYHEETGHAPAIGDGNVLRWKRKDNGSRSFDIWPPEDDDNGNGKAAAS